MYIFQHLVHIFFGNASLIHHCYLTIAMCWQQLNAASRYFIYKFHPSAFVSAKCDALNL